jgi:hypothetical protein
MPFDAQWFDELRGISADNLQMTRVRGIRGYVLDVGELCEAGYITSRFLEETRNFVRLMSTSSYRFDRLFCAYERHIANFPRSRAFRKQWNIAFTAGAGPNDDYVRIGVGFRLSAHEETRGIEEYLEFRQQVSHQQAGFDRTFQALGNYYEFENLEPSGPSICQNAVGLLSAIIIADVPPLNGWRFFGSRLWTHDPQDQAVIGSHERLRDAVVDVFNQIQGSGFGM